MAVVKFSDVLSGFEFANFGSLFEISAYISLDRGTVHYAPGDSGLDEELPKDLETSDRYLAIPHKNELDLGRALALAFIEEALPDDYDTVADYFRRRGAYARFKGLLEDRDMLSRWYEFENKATEAALRRWCKENDIQLIDG
jgi:hypothetical protein